MSRALAVLREPSSEQASRWHKPRKQPVSARLRLLAECLETEEGVRVLKRTDTGADLVVQLKAGGAVRITMRTDEIEVRSGPLLVKPDQGPPDPYVTLAEVCNLIDVLQVGTGFYVDSDALVGFDAVGECPSCQVEVFEWQDTCESCRTPLYPVRPGEDEHDGRSKRVVEALLRKKLIELVAPRGRQSVERAVSAFYGNGTLAPDALLGAFMEMPDVAEVYCDERTLFQILWRIR